MKGYEMSLYFWGLLIYAIIIILALDKKISDDDSKINEKKC